MDLDTSLMEPFSKNLGKKKGLSEGRAGEPFPRRKKTRQKRSRSLQLPKITKPSTLGGGQKRKL